MPVGDGPLDEAVQAFFHDREPEGGFVTRWFIAVEGLDSDGDRYMDSAWSVGMKTWDVRGLLGEALSSQLVGQLADVVEE